MKCVFSILFLFLVTTGNAQIKRTQNWFFGDSAGLNFHTTPPGKQVKSNLYSDEACASISDIDGNLLLYSDGIDVFDASHAIITNGNGLIGGKSSSNGVLFVPSPKNDSTIYLFTTVPQGQGGLYYSVIKQNSNGSYSITSKNIKLLDLSCESIGAVRHSNGEWFWIVVHEYGSNCFYSYLVTQQGVEVCPIISCSGFNIESNPFHAQNILKIDAKGELIAHSIYDLGNASGRVELFSFNSESGTIDFIASVNNLSLITGLEFSPSGNKLYIVERDRSLWQYQLNSQNLIAINDHSGSMYGSILLASDNIIYGCQVDDTALFLIQYPDLPDTSCRFLQSAISIAPATARFGLPNFVTSYFRDDAITLHYESSCTKDSFRFYCTAKSNIHLWKWVLLDEHQTRIDSSNSSEANFSIIDSGLYKIVLIADSDTLEKTFYKEPVLELGADTLLCNASQLMLSIPNNFRCIEWQDGSGSSGYTATISGKYSVSAVNLQGCRLRDTIAVQFIQLPVPIIFQNHHTLYTDTGYTYQWFFNGNPTVGTEYYLPIAQNGEYQVEISDKNGCSSLSDKFQATGVFVNQIEQQGFSIYPNPANTFITIHGLTHPSYVVYNTLGAIVLEGNGNQIQVGQLPDGLYFLVLEEDGKRYTKQVEVVH